VYNIFISLNWGHPIVYVKTAIGKKLSNTTENYFLYVTQCCYLLCSTVFSYIYFYFSFSVSSSTESRMGFGRYLFLNIHLLQYVMLSHRVCVSWRFEGSWYPVEQHFSNCFQVGTTFISQNVLWTTLILSSLKANCLRFSTIVCDTQFTLILFFLSFFWTNVQSKRTTRAEPEDHLWSADHSLRNAAVEEGKHHNPCRCWALRSHFPNGMVMA
jgi:hypothetical protein